MLSTAIAAEGSLRARPSATLSQLGEVLKEASRFHHDISVHSHDLSIDHESGALTLTTGVSHGPSSSWAQGPFSTSIRESGHRRLVLKDTALAQLAAKLNVPASYLRRCPPELLAQNINHWLQQDDNRELLLRCDGDQARAVLSPRYQRVDNI
ncbi:MAG: hypothetical protein KDB07_04935, partial [Planctomycetes bacterium]|nr:hypothetical protein [Planctomycetota bacterium]